MLVAGFVEIARLQYAPSPGNYYDEDARNNITPCQSIDDFNPYNYQVRNEQCVFVAIGILMS